MTIGHIIETSHNCNTFRMIPYAPYLLRSPSWSDWFYQSSKQVVCYTCITYAGKATSLGTCLLHFNTLSLWDMLGMQ